VAQKTAAEWQVRQGKHNYVVINHHHMKDYDERLSKKVIRA